MRSLILLLTTFLLVGCFTKHVAPINFDYSVLDENGLRGEGTGKVAVNYEFAIPRTELHRAEVAAIDTTVQFSTSRGRVGATSEEFLCIGSTHQEEYREVLERLRRLSYVKKIIETHWE